MGPMAPACQKWTSELRREERLIRDMRGACGAMENRDTPAYSRGSYPNCDLPLLKIFAVLYRFHIWLGVPNPEFVLRIRIDAKVGLGNCFGGRHRG